MSTDIKPVPIPAEKPPMDSRKKEPGLRSIDEAEKKLTSNPKVIAALSDLKSGDKQNRRTAAEQLASIAPDANREKVAKTLEGLMTDRDIFVLGAVTKAFLVWGDKENVPELITVTTHQSIFNRGAAMEVLATIKDERAAEAIARRLSNGLDRGQASQSLKAMGPLAEATVLKRLNSDIKEVRIEVCKILREIGTDKCVPALEQATRDADANVAREAKNALATVKP